MELHIELDNTLTLKFQVLDTPVAKLWVERMALRDQYPLDHPDRFYGFNSPEEERNRALNMIQSCVETINSYRPIIERTITDVTDQDTLNYLHNIFERYHGLLDQQDQDFWNSASQEVQRALAELNLAVHRCETVARGHRPRFVCTWYGLPKTETLTDELVAQCGVLNPAFGTVCLNYAEIGKTFEDLTTDRDNYIGEDAFKPFNHYSADFVVRFFEDTPITIKERLAKMEEYYDTHRSYFESRGYVDPGHIRLLPLRFPVAELIGNTDREKLIAQIQQHQHVTKVTIQ